MTFALPRLKLAPDETSFDFIKWHKAAIALSLLLIIGTFALIMTRGLNMGVDFTGGTLIEIQSSAPFDLGVLRARLNEAGVGSVSLQTFGDADTVLIRMAQQQDDAANKQAIERIKAELGSYFGYDQYDLRRVEYVGPQVGEELRRIGLIAFAIAMAGILIYVWVRFEWQFGVAAIIALVHDAILTIGFLAISRYEFDLSTMGAVLLIAGYSINDTIVTFDRIRENMRKYKKMSFRDICNLSTNQMLSRTLMTAVSTLLALVALATLGGEVIRGFSLTMAVGVVFGVYSSIYIAAALMLYMNVRRDDEDDTSPATAP